MISQTKAEQMVLIVEDDPDEQYLIKNSVNTSDYAIRFEFLEDGKALVDFLKAGGSPDLILLDLNLPVMNGIEALKTLAAQNILPNPIPIVIYSTSRSEREICQCYNLGANTFVTKPTGLREIKQCLATIFDYWFKTASICAHTASRA